MCHLVARELHKVAAPFFMYIVQLYKEDWRILHMLGCWAIALPSTEQIVTLFYGMLMLLHYVMLQLLHYTCIYVMVH